MESPKQVLDAAVEKCKGPAELARRIGVGRSRIADMQAGRDAISPETLGLLCNVLELDGDEARRLLAMLVIEAPKNAGKRAALQRAFFACWAIGVALGLQTVDALSNVAHAASYAADTTEGILARVFLWLSRPFALSRMGQWRPRSDAACPA